MIKFKRITKKLEVYKDVKYLYKTAFPKDERAPFALLMKKARRGLADFWAAYDDENWVGLIYVVGSGNLSYVFYYAIAEQERGKGIGTRVLCEIIKKYGGRVFLALEELDKTAENYPQRLNRYNFYRRCGLSRMNYKITEAKVTYDVMGVGGKVEPNEYAELMGNYLGKRMSRKINTKMFAAEPKPE